jgi:hypothetical protein
MAAAKSMRMTGLPTDPAPIQFRRELEYNTTFHVWALA